ncbi:MAG: DHHA1 domain-containing protein [Trueperaceae bacterium]|nr:DHHA1 domain-containing protein [Trueperaceae bacterium]
MRPEQIDPYRTTLDTRVLALRHAPSGTWVALQESLFYPTSGGQPFDTGVIAFAGREARVVDVAAAGPEAVLHRVEGAVPRQGEVVTCRIDWPRRYRHMQRHSAQHLLSQAFVRVSPTFETTSVSLEAPDATLDLAGAPDADAVAEAFALARDWGYANLQVDAFEVDEAELDRWPLRRPPKVSGRVRLVRMGEVELAACGGTHLARTAEALPLLPLGTKRVRGGATRVTFRAGLEAGERAEATVRMTEALAQSFSSRWDELPDRVAGLRDALGSAERAAAEARAAWADAAVRQAAAETGAGEGPRVLRRVVEDPALLEALATACAAHAPDAVALLAAREAQRVTLLFQAGPDAGVDVRPLLDAALPAVQGRGGGRPDRAQGAGHEPAGLDAALTAARAALRGEANG